MSLEDVVTYINEDEMIDVSPMRIRMRYVACCFLCWLCCYSSLSFA